MLIVTCFFQQLNRDEALEQRIKFLQDHVTTYGADTTNKGRILPCIEDAWTLPIPAELTQRQSAFKYAIVLAFNASCS